MDNTSQLPLKLSTKTDPLLLHISFTSYEILKILQNLDPNKAHGHDMIIILKLKLRGSYVCKERLNFKPCIENETYSSERKKANLVLVHKRNDKQLLKNYQPISGKVFERLINNIIFQFFINNH